MSEERTYGNLELSLEEIHKYNGSIGPATALDLVSHIRELLAENAALKADAERYRWLRKEENLCHSSWRELEYFVIGISIRKEKNTHPDFINGEILESAIDVAMKAEHA